ncbi:MAG TPA: dTDP-4-amino-4,6-dideoxygalactose transaminase [Allosphingosinicella sp.]|nr:dTDP-4-amino-4,6-dideoxygalactose transaminase [Allosphingosinicella sp.]
MSTPFNKPHLTGKELLYIGEALASGRLSGDGPFTRRAQARLEQLLGSGRSFLTTSCTDALEAAALLCDLRPGDEVIVPSFTFVSTANAFALRGATIRFADSLADHPNVDPAAVEALITPATKVVVPVHYAGVACDMDALATLAAAHDLILVEDAAQAIASSYKGRPLGTFGRFAAFSFHETKNVISGEGGALHVNDESFFQAAEIVREKGTNRTAFFRGDVDKYGWVSLGSSYLPSEMIAAFLLAQLEALDSIQRKRLAIWAQYRDRLGRIGADGRVSLPMLPNFATNNGHMFYLVCADLATRTGLIAHLRAHGIMAVFHYQALHASPYFAATHGNRPLPNAERYSDTLVRLPFYADLSADEVDEVCDRIVEFFR